VGAVLGCWAVGTWTVTAGEAILVDKGQPRAVLAASVETWTGTNAPQKALAAALRDFADIVERISGARLALATGAPPADAGVPLLVGDLAAARFGPPGKTTRVGQGWRRVVTPEAVGFIGESEEAVAYAMFDLLDRLGCRWYLPGDWGEVLPALPTLRLPEEDVSDAPRTIIRRTWCGDAAFNGRNRLGGLEVASVHGLEAYLTAEDLEQHPDWNGEVNGVRSRNGTICWGNPEVARAVAEKIMAHRAQTGVRTHTLSPRDAIVFCECARCKALDTGDWDPAFGCVSITDRYLHFANAIAAIVTETYPDEIFGACAYEQYTRPPLRERVHPSIIMQIAPILYCRAHSFANTNCPNRQLVRGMVEGWARATDKLAFRDYGYNLADAAAPFPLIAKWSEELPFLYEKGMVIWKPETMPTFESTLPGLVVGIRLAWHPDETPAAILDEFYTRFYGPAAGPMRDYWQAMDDAWTLVPEHAGGAYGHLRRFSPGVLAAGRQALNRALEAAPKGAEAKRVQLAADSFRMFEQVMRLRLDFAEGRWENLGRDARAWVDAWKELGKTYKAQHAFSPFAVKYFSRMFQLSMDDADRIANQAVLLTPVLRAWRWAVAADRNGETLGWARPDFDDAAWPVTDPCVETWSALGLWNAQGTSVWYRAEARLPELPTKEKVFLWIGAMDGTIKVFVNGRHVPYVNDKGESLESYSGYVRPASFDVTSAVRPGATNTVAIVGTRISLNELGTGGLMGPVVFYRSQSR
jgi:hypothetical protein